MLPIYREKCKVMYTDTDSFIYLIECDDVYNIMSATSADLTQAIMRSITLTAFYSSIKKYRA